MARILVSGQTPAAGQAAPATAMGGQAQAQNGIADIEVQLLSPRDLFFRGRKSGAMNVILQNAQGTCFIKDVVVTIDPGPLQAKLSELMPEERGIRIQGADNALVLSGEISNPLRLDDIVTLAGAYSDSKKIVNLHLNGNHRPMKLGLAWAREQKPRHVVEAFMHRCRSFISNEYIPGMTAPGRGEAN